MQFSQDVMSQKLVTTEIEFHDLEFDFDLSSDLDNNVGQWCRVSCICLPSIFEVVEQFY